MLSHETPVDEADLREYINDRIDREGAFVLTRSSGMSSLASDKNGLRSGRFCGSTLCNTGPLKPKGVVS